MSANGDAEMDESRLARLRRKARQDLRAAERAARRKRDEVARKARQDARTAGRRVRETSAREALAAVGERVGGRDAPEAPDGAGEIAERAGDAASVRAPMDATLDPGADGPALEGFAAASPMDDGGEAEDQDAALFDESLIAGGQEPVDDAAGGERSDEDAADGDDLLFEDAFGAAGGDGENDDERGFF